MEEKTPAENGNESGLNRDLPRIVFLGTPEFACPALSALVRNKVDPALVVTQPDRPRGRGRQPSPPPVKQLAQEYNIPVYQPERIREIEAVNHILSFKPDCLVAVAYGQILPAQLLEAPQLGALNIHPSLLPKYRGSAPIQRSILAGDTITGVTIMLLDSGMDTGPILTQEEVPIEPADNYGSMHDKLAHVGAELLLRTLVQWHSKDLQAVVQEEMKATLAPPIEKEELRISWDQPAADIANTIRAFDPWPGAFFMHEDKRIKCFDVRLLSWQVSANPGEVLGLSDDGLTVAGGDGRGLAIGALQLPGKRRLPAADVLRGYSLAVGVQLG